MGHRGIFDETALENCREEFVLVLSCQWAEDEWLTARPLVGRGGQALRQRNLPSALFAPQTNEMKFGRVHAGRQGTWSAVVSAYDTAGDDTTATDQHHRSSNALSARWWATTRDDDLRSSKWVC